jgi:hypothetical protein
VGRSRPLHVLEATGREIQQLPSCVLFLHEALTVLQCEPLFSYSSSSTESRHLLLLVRWLFVGRGMRWTSTAISAGCEYSSTNPITSSNLTASHILSRNTFPPTRIQPRSRNCGGDDERRAELRTLTTDSRRTSSNGPDTPIQTNDYRTPISSQNIVHVVISRSTIKTCCK